MSHKEDERKNGPRGWLLGSMPVSRRRIPKRSNHQDTLAKRASATEKISEFLEENPRDEVGGKDLASVMMM